VSELDLRQLGRRMRRAREHAALSQAEVAEVLGLTPAAISQYESGKRRVDALSLERLTRLYGVGLSFFFGQNQDEEVEWQAALRALARQVGTMGKAGISLLIERLHLLEDLYSSAGMRPRGPQHPPFAALPEADYAEYQLRDYAQETREHFALGKAPVLDMKSFLEAHGYLVFSIPLGKNQEGGLSGLYFQHPGLGRVTVVNEDRAYSRWAFTLAHEFAHGLYHYDRPAILCRQQDKRPLEAFANGFASHFLVPEAALHERLQQLGTKTVQKAEDVVKLSRYFGVSFGAMKRRLQVESRLQVPMPELESTRPVLLAKKLGFHTNPHEFGLRPLPLEDRFPRVYLQLAYEAVRSKRLSLRRAAEILGLSYLELQDRLDPPEVEEEPEEVSSATA
jgi:Zn-dependent peptidase ImmA (M78 family)/transcriptional regulator with XRE-family HTH domain